MQFSQAYPGTAAVLVDEFDAGQLRGERGFVLQPHTGPLTHIVS